MISLGRHENKDVITNDHRQTRKKKRKNKKMIGSFFGGILGGIVSAYVVFTLLFNGVNDNTARKDISPPIVDESTPVTKVNSTDEVGVNINEISQAIVGVINIQKQNIWTGAEDANVGSGIIYKQENDKAYIVTNNHVVKEAEEVEITLQKDERIKAKVLGTDELSDLAVLAIDAEQINHVANLGLSGDLHVGETVYAIGNPLGLEFSGSVTKGIVSGLDRSVKVNTSGQNQNPDWEMQVIQTDAAINPGNSGGALINTQGEVVGINSMKIAQSTVEGIGFAIPIDTALPIMEQLEANGEVVRPFIGIAAVALHEVPIQYRQNITLPEGIDGGVVIAEVEDDSPASNAGIKQFDVITKINDTTIKSMLNLRKYLYSETSIGDEITLEVFRDGEKINTKLELTK